MFGEEGHNYLRPPSLDFRDVSFDVKDKKLLSSYFLNFFRSKDGLFELVWQEDGTVTFKGMTMVTHVKIEIGAAAIN